MERAEGDGQDFSGLVILKSIYRVGDASHFFFADVGNWFSVML
jgi:hypothetical protein